METGHENVKDYKCESCEKRFGSKGNLKIHIETVHKKLKILYL